jgi:hypothetical protein
VKLINSILIPTLLFTASCRKNESNNKDSALTNEEQEKEKIEKEKAEKEAAEKAASKEHFDSLKLGDFCRNLKFLTISPDILETIKTLCNESAPTETFENIIRNAYEDAKGPLVFPLSEINELPDEKSQFRVGFALKIPKLKADEIRKADTNGVLLAGVQLELQNMTVEKLSDVALDGLNFQRTEFRYKIVVKGPQSTEFRNERETVMNQYQVSAQRDDLALTTETLKESADKNRHFDWAKTVNMIVGNPRDGGSYIVTVVDFKTWNQGFHKVNTNALNVITKANAEKVYNYLKDLGK